MSVRLDLDDMQGLIARGYGKLPHAAYLLLQITEADPAREVLRGWAKDLTTADEEPDSAATNLALSSAGIAKLGGSPLLAGLSRQFGEGMVTPHRSRLLGDLGENDPAGWTWGGPGTDVVHVLLLIYSSDPTTLTARCDDLGSAPGLRLVRRLDTAPVTPTESFGFADGISQPWLEGLGPAPSGSDLVRAGEFVLGYPNEYDQLTPRPLLPDGLDVGRNGCYLVIRQLSQDVDGFWAYLDAAATGADGRLDLAQRDLLAAKMMGRWPSGAPLALAPEHDDPALATANDFGYGERDAHGMHCPVGAHVRRANPRDSLEPSPGTAESRRINRRHRLLRRGRAYGEPGTEQGLHFICLGGNLARQYEFVQHTWVNNPDFDGLFGEEDPVIGPRRCDDSRFTVPDTPVRRRVRELPQFVQVRGGGYFFLPGVRALSYLVREQP